MNKKSGAGLVSRRFITYTEVLSKVLREGLKVLR